MTPIINLPSHRISALPPPRLHPYHLGASLYMPATRHDIWSIITRQKIPTIHSIIICLEDAVHESDLPTALDNIKTLLHTWHDSPPKNRPLVFIRPRHANMLRQLSEFVHIDCIDGFVLPKVDMVSLADWRYACQNLSKTHFIMPTLETALVFGATHNQELAVALSEGFDQEILAVRVGGNDLLACLRMRRLPNVTLYQSPLGTLLYRLLGIFVPHGFYLSSPVFEYLDKPDLFKQELYQDVALGLVGKTVIHPSQIDTVIQAFKVSSTDYAQACAILSKDAKAVFKQDNTMLEPATHQAWAMQVMARKDVFGLVVSNP
ncbi:MAG: HpcH/HpaI aldolase/citrate lyase family protein [Moraxella sp.]|nr:HpcH/HpaI aldolase/citrate lyase family protein [Moraxella sp.]